MLDLPYGEGRRRAWLFDRGIVTAEEETDAGHRVFVHWTERQEDEFRRL